MRDISAIDFAHPKFLNPFLLEFTPVKSILVDRAEFLAEGSAEIGTLSGRDVQKMVR